MIVLRELCAALVFCQFDRGTSTTIEPQDLVVNSFPGHWLPRVLFMPTEASKATKELLLWRLWLAHSITVC